MRERVNDKYRQQYMIVFNVRKKGFYFKRYDGMKESRIEACVFYKFKILYKDRTKSITSVYVYITS